MGCSESRQLLTHFHDSERKPVPLAATPHQPSPNPGKQCVPFSPKLANFRHFIKWNNCVPACCIWLPSLFDSLQGSPALHLNFVLFNHWIIFHCLNMSHLFLVRRLLGCVHHFLAVIISVVMNIHLGIFIICF